jgi:hypothetical protein
MQRDPGTPDRTLKATALTIAHPVRQMMLRPMRPIIAACAVLCLVACTPRDRNTWHPAPPGGESPSRVARANEPTPRHTAVVFAPVAIGDLAAIWPDASETFSYDLADRIDVLGSKADADGLAGPDLPVADSAEWRAWPVAGTGGADLVVLTVVQSIERREAPPNAQGQRLVTCTVLIEMRALDAFGNVVFSKRGRGDWEGFPSPKFPGPESKPESRTAWEACSNAVGALLDFLEKRNEAVVGGPAPTAEQLVEVEIASDPPGADVLVDGIFRGNTPCTLKLPIRRMAMRIERSGHVSWERIMIPDAGMKIRPVLEKQ